MQTHIVETLLNTPEGREADAILRNCTHCGFCLANCPTYRLLGNELDSPRGRIYQIKQVLEGAQPTDALQLHLDRCLTCRACETTCPSGVQYNRLLDLGREVVETRTTRRLGARLGRQALRGILMRRRLFASLLVVARTARPFLPKGLADKIPERRSAPGWPLPANAETKVLLLEGCVQPAIDPVINPWNARLLAALGRDVIRTTESACCGAMDHHLGDSERSRAHARRNIDTWWPHVEAGAEAIIVNASGCGVFVKDYDHLLAGDPDYSEKARKIARLAKDPIEYLEPFGDRLTPAPGAPTRIAFQSPCTLQHGQRLSGRVETLLTRIGFELVSVTDPHICCGSAGTYSMLQPQLAQRLRDDKLANLERDRPDAIATANIGCLSHLAGSASVPVRHWLELVAAKPLG